MVHLARKSSNSGNDSADPATHALCRSFARCWLCAFLKYLLGGESRRRTFGAIKIHIWQSFICWKYISWHALVANLWCATFVREGSVQLASLGLVLVLPRCVDFICCASFLRAWPWQLFYARDMPGSTCWLTVVACFPDASWRGTKRRGEIPMRCTWRNRKMYSDRADTCRWNTCRLNNCRWIPESRTTLILGRQWSSTFSSLFYERSEIGRILELLLFHIHAATNILRLLSLRS